VNFTPENLFFSKMPLTKNNKKYGNEILKEALDQINNGEISIYAAGKKI
jgi:hypothetical protein